MTEITKDKVTASIVASLYVQLEMIYGSFELPENIEQARKESSMDATFFSPEGLAWYLDGYTPEERAERKRRANMRPVGILEGVVNA